MDPVQLLHDLLFDYTVRTVALGSAQQFVATGTYSDNSTQDLTASVAWTSSR